MPHLGRVKSVCGVGLAVSAGGQETGPGRQGGRHANDILAHGGQLLSRERTYT
ncbi:hypothetical protein [Streptomyces broussonetiae]|uniref:hypothetical protein n=1 Tax=Streptomyces broussonetiae TaxID=2686304 RepID=UPI0035DC1C7F